MRGLPFREWMLHQRAWALLWMVAATVGVSAAPAAGPPLPSDASVAAPAPLPATPPVDASDARRRIADARAAVLQRHAAEERACSDRFAVTACIDDVRARQRAALAPLREQELALDDADRQRRAAERQAAVAARQQSRALAATPPAAAAREQMPPAAGRAEAGGGLGRTGPVQARVREPANGSRTARDPVLDAEQEQARAARAAARARDAEARRLASQRAQERIAQRLQEQARRPYKGQPLPAVPSAAPASGPGR